jgi:RNA polymerase sigma factor (TIGR02999 family)
MESDRTRGNAGSGDPGNLLRPATDELFATLYSELRRLADREVRRLQGRGSGISPTTLLHEAYLDFAHRGGLGFEDRARFFAYAARAMRGLLIDLLRERRAVKRGGGFHITALDGDLADRVAEPIEEFERLNSAVDALARVEPELALLVELKYFCGCSFAEIAALGAVSERTVQRDWQRARLFLRTELDAE